MEFEERPGIGDTKAFVRQDRSQPITFRTTGSIPVLHIQACLRILNITEKEFLYIWNSLFPE